MTKNYILKRDVCYCGDKHCYICGGTPVSK